MTKKVPLTEDPAFRYLTGTHEYPKGTSRDLNVDDLGPEWDNTLMDGLEDLDWDDEQE